MLNEPPTWKPFENSYGHNIYYRRIGEQVTYKYSVSIRANECCNGISLVRLQDDSKKILGCDTVIIVNHMRMIASNRYCEEITFLDEKYEKEE